MNREILGLGRIGQDAPGLLMAEASPLVGEWVNPDRHGGAAGPRDADRHE